MLKILIELDDMEDVTGYSMGHIQLEGDKGGACSKYKTPSQAMMIFLSIVSLLDGVSMFLESKQTSYEFIGSDSSFSIVFKKISNRIKLSSGGGEITTLDATDLIRFIWKDVKAFLDDVLPKLSKDDIAYNDLISSLKEFEELIACK